MGLIEAFKAKKIFIYSLYLLLVVILAPAAVSIGISSEPLPRLYFFKPNMELTISMKCFDYTDDCEPYAEGKFSENVVFSSLKETGQNEKGFTAAIKMPQDIGAPGEHKLYIGVTDIDKRSSSGISVITKVRKVLRFMALYDEKYADVSFSAPNINENEKEAFLFDVSNFGKDDLVLVYGEVDVFNSQGEKVGSAKSGSTGIKSTESAAIKAEWDSKGIKSGQYTAAGRLFYDGNEKLMNQTFLIGTKDVEIISHTMDFEESRISRMDINVRNTWNGPINELYGVVRINKTEFKTPSIPLGAFQEGILNAYIDASQFRLGKHDIEITLHFDGSQRTEESSINIFRAKGKGIYLPMQIGMNSTTLLTALILLLLLLNIIFIIWTKRKKNNL